MSKGGTGVSRRYLIDNLKAIINDPNAFGRVQAIKLLAEITGKNVKRKPPKRKEVVSKELSTLASAAEQYHRPGVN